jgi:hypothetical protein
MDSRLEQVISILSSGIVRRKAANGINAQTNNTQKKIEKTGIARKATRKKRGK